MAAPVPVVFVVLGDRELGFDYLLDLLRIPFIEEVFLGLLSHLLSHVLFDALPRAVVIHTRAEYVERAERFAVEFLPRQQIGYKSGLPASAVREEQRPHGGTGKVFRRTLLYRQLGIILYGLHAQAAHLIFSTDSICGLPVPLLLGWSPNHTGTSPHNTANSHGKR